MIVQERHNHPIQMVIVLLFLFLLSVILDVATTQWLILNSPGGIVNESNPLGVVLYEQMGFAGLIIPKSGLFIVFAGMMIYFTLKFSEISWLVEVAYVLVLCQMVVSIVVVFNNFAAILATLFVKGVWPVIDTPRWLILSSVYLADIALGAIFANGVMYIWGLTRPMLHLKVLVGLLLFVSPVMLFAESFRIYVWLYVVYVASASLAIGIAFYLSESGGIRIRG
ncbi:MAG: hypothetical protein ACE5KU_00190 [Nitrososphaerales archaeon]